MNEPDVDVTRVAEISSHIIPAPGHDALLEGLNRAWPGLSFRVALTRRGWYRVGGVIGPELTRVTDNLAEWVEQECGGDVGLLQAKYADAGYIATRLNGKTHYLVASTGERACDFIQLEIEEIQEVQDRRLIDADWLPDSLEDCIDPMDYPRLAPEPLGKSRYLLRRITPIAAFIDKLIKTMEFQPSIVRFVTDWENSSSAETNRFCDRWILSLREYTDGYGEPIVQVRPLSTFNDKLEVLDPGASARGSRLANLIHGFDRQLGYPMAWYFYMLTQKKVSPRVAEAIHNDLQGAYDYLPPRDLKVLKNWSKSPYSV